MQNGRNRLTMKNSHWKLVFILIMTAGIFNGILYGYSNNVINPDESNQVSEMFSLVNGRGLTIPIAKPIDISNTISIPLTRFPPGYSILFALEYLITNNPGLCDFLLYALGVILFFLAWFFIFEFTEPRLGRLTRLLVGIFWVFFTPSLQAGAISSHTTEILSISFLSINIVFSIAVFKHPKWTLLFGALAGIASGLAASMRTLYWPLIVATPLALVIIAWRNKEIRREILFAAIANIFISGLFVFSMIYFNWVSTGHMTGYMMNDSGDVIPRLPYSNSIQWGHWSLIIPFLIFTLGYVDPSIMRINTAQGFEPPFLLDTRISWFIFGVLLFAYLYSCFNILNFSYRSSSLLFNDKEKEDEMVLSFLSLAGLLICIMTFSTIAQTSLLMDLHPFSGGWIPIMELRYFTPFFSFVFIGAIHTLCTILARLRKSPTLFIGLLPLLLIFVPALLFTIPSQIKLSYESLTSFKSKPFAVQVYENSTEDILTLINQHGCKDCPIVVHVQEPNWGLRSRIWSMGLTYIVTKTPALGREPRPVSFSTSRTTNVIFAIDSDMDNFIKNNFLNSSSYTSDRHCVNQGQLCLFIMHPSSKK